MLTCAVVIPLMAIFGGPVSDLTERFWKDCHVKTPKIALKTDHEAPRFQAAPLPALPLPAGPTRSQPLAWPSEGSHTPAQGVDALGRSPGIPTSAHLAAGSPGIAMASDLPPGPVASMPRTDEAILASYETSMDRQTPHTTGSDEATYIQQRLRQLGAIHYVLESWGRDGNYRFSCRIAIEGNPGYTRYFEATNRDGLSAMNRVLQQVEAYRHLR